MARAMNHDFAPKAKAMFQSEIDAAREAIDQDLYISYRQPGKDFDCYRVGSVGKCFCGHTLAEHARFNGSLFPLESIDVFIYSEQEKRRVCHVSQAVVRALHLLTFHRGLTRQASSG